MNKFWEIISEDTENPIIQEKKKTENMKGPLKIEKVIKVLFHKASSALSSPRGKTFKQLNLLVLPENKKEALPHLRKNNLDPQPDKDSNI